MKMIISVTAVVVFMVSVVSADAHFADMEELSLGVVGNAVAIGDFYSYVQGGAMSVIETNGSKVLKLNGSDAARIYNNVNAEFDIGFSLSFDFSIVDTGDNSRGARIAVIRANLADGTTGAVVAEIAVGDRGVYSTGNQLMYTDGISTRAYGYGASILNNIDYIMHIWSEYEDAATGKYNITVTPKSGGSAVYSITGKSLILGGSSISEFSQVYVGQYAGTADESIAGTLDNVSFSNATPKLIYEADIEDQSTGIVVSAAAIGDFYSYVESNAMSVVESGGNKVLELNGAGTARIYNNVNAKFDIGFDFSFDFSISETGDNSRGARIVNIRANLADGTTGAAVAEIAIGDCGVSGTGNKLLYTDGDSTRQYESGYLIVNNTEYVMRIWSDYSDTPAGTYNITVTPKAGGSAVYNITGKSLILGGSSISEFSQVSVGQYAGTADESIECTLDNISFSQALPAPPFGTSVILN